MSQSLLLVYTFFQLRHVPYQLTHLDTQRLEHCIFILNQVPQSDW